MSSKNLHPIYVALDQYQYSRAVKLALALPSDHILGRALLAVAYQKSGQHEKALFVVADLLINDTHTEEFWFELKAKLARTSPPPPQAAVPQPSPVKAKGKKNKKKGVATAGSCATPIKELPPSLRQRPPVDWVQELDDEASFPEKWDKMEISKAPICDETVLATLSIPIQGMHLNMTLYQMYLGACQYVTVHDKQNTDLLVALLSRSFDVGLRWLAHSKPSRVQLQILSTLQVTALQLARSSAQDMKKYTAWAARATLWQYEELSSALKEKSNDEKSTLPPKLEMTLRLAASLAQKSLSSPPTAQDCWLYIDVLRRQQRYQEVLEWLENVENDMQQQREDTEFTAVHMDEQQVKQRKAEMYVTLHAYHEGAKVYEELIEQHADDWSYWMGYLSCCFRHSGLEDTLSKGQSLVDSILGDRQPPLPRGPYLVKVELAAMKVRGGLSSDIQEESLGSFSEDHLDQLREKIIEYASHWSLRASCAFSDLEPYVKLLVRTAKNVSGKNTNVLMKLLAWAKALQGENCQHDSEAREDAKHERYKLRAYIFGVKLVYLLVEELNLPVDDTGIVSSTDLLKEWEWATTRSGSEGAKDTDKKTEEEVVQKENQPGDELILIAVKRVLESSSSDSDDRLYLAASLLELGMKNSPHNAYLAISAMDVYAKLNASWRSWELYQTILSLKHVQLDSCSYLMLDKLIEGGLYNELVEESGNILKFHATTLKDTGDFLTRAMQHRSLNKAHEFLVFQRQRLNHSLTRLDAKHFIMNCAPLVHVGVVAASPKKNKGEPAGRPLAAQYGIIGGSNDLQRAMDMVNEAKNPLGAPSIVSLDAVTENQHSDNRDVSLLHDQRMQTITPLAKEQVITRSLQSGHVHGLLIRAALCVDACKGPKKGKIQKPTAELLKRCNSLLSATKSASQFCQKHSDVLPAAYSELFQSFLDQCLILSVVTCGIPCRPDDKTPESDSLVDREKRISEMLPGATSHLRAARTKFNLTSKKASVSIPIVCRLVPDCLVAILALLKMHGSLFAAFGWGKRKRRTKPGAGALADFASSLRELVSDMTSVLSSLLIEESKEILKLNEVEEAVSKHLENTSLDPSVSKEVARYVTHSQNVTRDRVLPFLDHVMSELDSYEVSEEC